MKKLSNQELADNVFKNNVDAYKVFVCGVFGFITENAAELHANSSVKKLKVFEFHRKEDAKKETNTTDQKPVKLDKLNKEDLTKAAELKGIRVDPSLTKKAVIELIEALDNAPVNDDEDSTETNNSKE